LNYLWIRKGTNENDLYALLNVSVLLAQHAKSDHRVYSSNVLITSATVDGFFFMIIFFFLNPFSFNVRTAFMIFVASSVPKIPIVSHDDSYIYRILFVNTSPPSRCMVIAKYSYNGAQSNS